MYFVDIWHAAPDFEAWKKTFDSDPLDREGSGVRSYSVTRPVDDPKTVIGHLEFDSLAEAEAFALRLRKLWSDIGLQADLRICEIVEAKDFKAAGRRAA